MTQLQFTIRCPHCRSQNIHPLPAGDLWGCRDCGKTFDLAAVQMSPPEPPAKPRRKGAPK